ncbi:hypothetical protein BC830DRAFT_1101238 [Chytriomyces sp. MP71]|nr:hypothetical protein BC830DRAFT_1101238 [Chytriomyces sp. MP71]
MGLKHEKKGQNAQSNKRKHLIRTALGARSSGRNRCHSRDRGHGSRAGCNGRCGRRGHAHRSHCARCGGTPRVWANGCRRCSAAAGNSEPCCKVLGKEFSRFAVSHPSDGVVHVRSHSEIRGRCPSEAGGGGVRQSRWVQSIQHRDVVDSVGALCLLMDRDASARFLELALQASCLRHPSSHLDMHLSP